MLIINTNNMENWKITFNQNRRNRIEQDLKYLRNIINTDSIKDLSNVEERDIKRRILDKEEELEELNREE